MVLHSFVKSGATLLASLAAAVAFAVDKHGNVAGNPTTGSADSDAEVSYVTFTDTLASGGLGPVMVVIPAGSFRMGCLNDDGDCYVDEFPVHTVNVPRFALAKYELTFEQWDACLDAGGCDGYRAHDRGWGRGDRPVIRLNHAHAQSYVSWLSQQTGEDYRLPSESEWEYAARAGTETQYDWGNTIGTNRANCTECGSQWDHSRTAPVGSFAANPWGLFDMHGNVWEWTADCDNASYAGAPSDGSAWTTGRCSMRVLRGGAWDSHPDFLRARYRGSADVSLTTDVIGLRVARAVDVVPSPGSPDLEVRAVTVTDANPGPGGAFTLSATVRNAGAGASASTTLRYYRSVDATMSTGDAAAGTDAVAALAAGETSSESVPLTAPTGAGTYYYGACVDAVADESDATDNCSASVRVDVGLSSDASLSALALTWDDAGTATDIALNPVFNAATTSYAAGVANAVDQITIKETKGDSGARVDYLDGTDAALTDADTNAAGFQFGLAVGANTIKAKVAASDGETTRSYAVVVTRAADAAAPTATGATVDGATLVVAFNEGLAAAANLSNSAFAVKKTASGGSETAVALADSPSISGARVTLTLATAVVSTDADVKVGYTRPATGTDNALEDANGNEVADFADLAATNETAAATLTASFENVPDAHDGASAFALDLVFSEAVFDGTEPFDKNQRIRSKVSVTGGTLRSGRRADPAQYDRWVLRVGPSGAGEVTVTLAADGAACNAGGICTPDGVQLSGVARATVAGPQAEEPDAPSAPTLTSGTDWLEASWTAPADNGSAIADYDVHYRTPGGNWTDADHAGTSTTKRIEGLAADTAYEVRVRATNAGGAGDWSAAAPGRTAAAATLTASFENVPSAHDGASAFALDLVFSEAVFDGTESFNKNERIRSKVSVTGGTLRSGRRADPEQYDRWVLRVGPSGAGEVTVTLAADGAACDAGGICTPDGVPLSGIARATVAGPPAGVPDAPSAPTLTSGTDWLEASWTAPADNGSAITDYDVHYRATGGNWTDADHAGTSTTKRIGGLAADTDHEVRVRAANAEGAGDWSPSASRRTGASDGASEGDVRLVGGGTEQEGRVEIHHDGEWGTVCDDRFVSEDAEVVCRQLGYAGGEVHTRAAFGEGAGTIWMDDVQCAGSESRLADCPFGGWGLHNCRHSEDVGVSCGTSGNSLSQATVSGAVVTLRFDRPLDGGSVPSPDDFVVAAGSPAAAVPVASVAVAGGDAALTLSRAVEPSAPVTVSYLPAPMHPLQDASFNPAAAFTGHAVGHAHAPTSPKPTRRGARAPESPARPPPAAGPERGSKIEVLDLSSRGLAELSALAGLADLEVLDLGGNRVADLQPLAAMAGLEVLDLRANAVVDVSALGNLRHLRVLDLSDNAVSDVSPLAGLTALRRLDLSGNRVADLGPLSELRGLEVLLLDGNEVSDLVPLWGLTDLAHLGLGNNRVADAALLRDLRSLRRLDLAGTGLADVSALGEARNLVWLRVAGNPIADYSPLGRLMALRWLVLDARPPRPDAVRRRNGDRVPLLLIETPDG